MPYLLPVGIGKRITVNTEQRNNTVKSRRKRCRQFVELLEWNHRRKAVAHSSDSGKGETVMDNGGREQGISLLQAECFGVVFLALVWLMKLRPGGLLICQSETADTKPAGLPTMQGLSLFSVEPHLS